MILRHDAVREAAKDWQTYSSNHPFRVPIPSEENLRTMRQLPIETDPPDHKIFRDIIEPFFRRPKDPQVIASTEALIDRMLTEALTKPSVEIVRDFALPLQSRALTLLLNVPESEAETWIAWGIHVFHDTSTGSSKGQTLETYLQNRFDQAEANPGDDFFTALTRATVQTSPLENRPLTREIPQPSTAVYPQPAARNDAAIRAFYHDPHTPNYQFLIHFAPTLGFCAVSSEVACGSVSSSP
jgi:cytochrome P450